jgi:K+:H+ antiporter subunit KhtU
MTESVHQDIVSPENPTGEIEIERVAPAASIPAHVLPWHVRFGLSWSAGAVPVVLILLLGAVLGPGGLALLTPPVLAVIDPVLPVAVAALGILAGLEFSRRAAPNRWSLLRKASIESALTLVLVSAGIWLVMPASTDVGMPEAWLVAIVAGLCASMSATLPDADPDRLRPAAIRMRDFDAFLPAAIGALVLAFLHSQSVLAALGLTIQATILALMISAAAWLLLADSSPSTEQRVFSIAALLLVGGIADYLSLSALAGGILAGLFWGYVGGAARDSIERDVRYLRHPLVVLMLLAAGAKLTFSGWILLLAVAYVLVRVAGKLLGGWLARRVPGVAIPDTVGATLLPPGVFGIAFALDATSMMQSSANAILAATVLGSIGCQLLAALWRPAEAHE